MDEDIALKIEQAFRDDEKKTINSANLRLTRGAFEKIMTYAKVVSRMAGSGMECYGYLLTPRDSIDGLITDMYFANDQEALSAYVRVTEEGVFHTLRDVEALGYKIVGWWHSHGTMHPFHSGTDVTNFLTILHSIAPLTMFRNEESVFALNNLEQRLEFDNYILTATNIQQLQRIKIIKKTEQDPFAFSLVVNQFGDYYKERITKTRRGKEFAVNKPTRPQVEIINIDDDIRFAIDQIEKDVFFKIKINGRSAREVFAEFNQRTSDVGKMYAPLIKRFLDKAADYTGPKENLELVTATLQQNPFLEENFIDYFNKRRLNINTSIFNALEKDQFEALYLLRLMKRFSGGSEQQVFDRFKQDIERLEQAFRKSLETTKALTSYASEIFTDYYKIQNHKYKTLINRILNRLCTNKYVPIAQAFKEQTSQNTRDHKDFFLYDDRRQITNQLLMAELNYPQMQPQNIMDFLTAFTEAYQSSPEKCDALIEQKLLKDATNHSSYQDLPAITQKKSGKIYGLFGAKNARANN